MQTVQETWIPWCSSGKVSTRPLVCKRQGYGSDCSENHSDSPVAVIEKVVDLGLQVVQFLGAVVEETVELPLLQSSSS